MARVFITGGSGFVGSAIIDELLRRNHDVTALEDRRSVDTRGGAIRTVKGNLFDTKALDAGIAGSDAVIHLVGIIMQRPRKGVTFQRIHFEGAKNVVDATIRGGVKRYIHMSALGVRPDAVSDYHKTKFLAEEKVRASSLDWTIFRPSLIHGEKGEFMQMEAKWARGTAPPFLFMPYFGAGPFGTGGAGRLAPVYVDDIARAFVEALEKPATIGEVYPLAGPDRLTWPQLHRAIAHAVTGKHRWVMAMPVWKAKLITHLAPPALLPFNRDQVIMSQEDNVADMTKFNDHFGWEPQPFEPALATYAKKL
jgi:NADH dehydrogenase